MKLSKWLTLALLALMAVAGATAQGCGKSDAAPIVTFYGAGS